VNVVGAVLDDLELLDIAAQRDDQPTADGEALPEITARCRSPR
jgi:hypothetical protein